MKFREFFESLLFQENSLSLAKVAMVCAMVGNEYDDELVKYLETHNIKAVITRAGGSGDNLKHKILRNAFGAVENTGLLLASPKNRHALTRLVEDILRAFDSPILSVAGGGVKIGIAVYKNDLAMAIYGTLGIPGLDVDYQVSASRTLHFYLD